MQARELTDDTYSLLRSYMKAYDRMKTEKHSQGRKETKSHRGSRLFVPPIAPCRLKKVKGYRLCWSVGAVEVFRSAPSTQKSNVSASFLRSLPSITALSEGWKSALGALERFQDHKITSPTRFRVTVLGLPRCSNKPPFPDTFTSLFVATWLGQGIKDAFGWSVDLENYEVEVVATVIVNETASRTVGVLSLGLTLCRATSSECIAGLLANQSNNRKATGVTCDLTDKNSRTSASGSIIVQQMLAIISQVNEAKASWCLVRRAIKSDIFRRKLLNVTNKRGETPLILAAKACDTRLVSLILALGKRNSKLKEVKLPPRAPVNSQPVLTVTPLQADLGKKDHRQYDALMHSCERGDNSTVSVLLNHKTATHKWGFNKLCERCLSVAASANQHHTLNLVLHNLLTTKGPALQPALCWPALQAAISTGNSLTTALLLDYMRLMTEKRISTSEGGRSRLKDRLPTHQRPPLTVPKDVFMGIYGPPSLSVTSKQSFSSPCCPVSWVGPASEQSGQWQSIINLLIRARLTVLLGGGRTMDVRQFLGIGEDVSGTSLPQSLPSLEPLHEMEQRRGEMKEAKKQPEVKTGLMDQEDKEDEKQVDAKIELDEDGMNMTCPPKNVKLPKQKRTRAMGGGLASQFVLYDEEKSVWLSTLLHVFQQSSTSYLCSPVLQLVLNYLVV